MSGTFFMCSFLKMKKARAKAIRFLRKPNVKKYFAISFLICMILMIVFFMTPLFFILVFLAMNAVLGFFMRPFKTLGLGLELGVFATVVASCAYGPVVGVIGGLMVLLAKLILQGSFSLMGMILVPSHVIIGILAYYIFDPAAMNIASVGIGFTVFHSIFTSILSFFFLGGNMGKIAVFVFTNIPWNVFLFTYFAPKLVQYLL